MGLFDFLLTNTSKSENKSQQDTTQKQQNTSQSATQQTGTQNQTNTQTGTQTTDTNTKQQTGSEQKQQTTGSQATTGKQTSTTLDPQIQAMLASLIPGLVGNVDGSQGGVNPNVAGLENIAALLANNGADNGDIENQILAANEVAKQNFATGEGAQIKQTQQQVGSTGNSFSQLIQQQGNKDLSVQLANTDATIRAQAKAQSTNDFQAAIQALTGATSADIAEKNQPTSQLLAIVQALSGATTTTDTSQQTDTIQSLIDSISQLTSQQSQGTTASTLTDILNAITSANSKTGSSETADASSSTTGSSSGKNTSTQGLLGQVTNLIAAAKK